MKYFGWFIFNVSVYSLGTKGLGVVVVKPGERYGCKNRNIQVDEMIKIRGIEISPEDFGPNATKKKKAFGYPFDLNKVVLGAKFNDTDLHFSDVILDKVRLT